VYAKDKKLSVGQSLAQFLAVSQMIQLNFLLLLESSYKLLCHNLPGLGILFPKKKKIWQVIQKANKVLVVKLTLDNRKHLG
jgi:hypothetical protein